MGILFWAVYLNISVCDQYYGYSDLHLMQWYLLNIDAQINKLMTEERLAKKAAKPPLYRVRTDSTPSNLQFDKIPLAENLTQYPNNCFARKPSQKHCPEDEKRTMKRDYSQRRVYFPLNPSENLLKRHPRSITKDARDSVEKFKANCKMNFRTKRSENDDTHSERTQTFQMVSSKITYTLNKNNPVPAEKHQGKVSPPKRHYKIAVKRLSFKTQKQASLIPTENGSSDSSNTKGLNPEDNLFGCFVFKRKESLRKGPVLDHFQRGKLLGKGYFGEVYLVKHKQIGLVCAMKIISRELVKKEKTEDQLIRELKISSFVSHSNIVQVYGYFVDEKNIYILQQLLTDDELYKIMKRKRVLTQRQTSNIINQALYALQYLHQNNITHRDIKPENMLVEKGVVKFCDFGWAVYDPLNFRTSSIGTLLYLSPENVKGDGYDRRNDIWAIGVLTYQMLVGNVPFIIWGEDEKHKIMYEDVKFPLYVDVSETAQDFILRMLKKNPDERSTISQLQTHPFLASAGMMEYVPLD